MLPAPTRVVIVPSLNRRHPALGRNTIPVLPNSVLRIPLSSIISPRRNNRSKKERKDDLLVCIGEGVLAIRSCKRCEDSKEPCKLGNGSEKCTKCIKDQKFCDLSVPPAMLRRAHKERLRLRDKVRETKLKLNRPEAELQDTEDKEENLVRLEWRNISELEDEPPVNNSINLDNFLFDVSSEQVEVPPGFDFGGLVDVGGTIVEASGSS